MKKIIISILLLNSFLFAQHGSETILNNIKVSGVDMDSIRIDGGNWGTSVGSDDPLAFALDWPSGMAHSFIDLWRNDKGASITIDSIKCTADDTADVDLYHCTFTGGSATRIDTFDVETVGTNRFYHTETTISSASIADESLIYLEKCEESVNYLLIIIYWH